MSKFKQGAVVRVTHDQYTGPPAGTLGVYLYGSTTSVVHGLKYHVIKGFDGEEYIVYHDRALEEVTVEP